MRILVVSNLYPPHAIGGYEHGCEDAVEGLRALGHDIWVLTSTYGVQEPSSCKHVFRWLEVDLGWRSAGVARAWRLTRKEIGNKRAFKRLCSTCQPDVVYFWNLGFISLSLVPLTHRMNIPSCQFVFDSWQLRYTADSWYSLWNGGYRHTWARTILMALRPIIRLAGLLPHFHVSQLSRIQFASDFLKRESSENGVHANNSSVIRWGVNAEQFACTNGKTDRNRLLYVGHLVHHKGLHTVVEALALIVHEHDHTDITLTVVGGSLNQQYEMRIRKLIHARSLETHVTLLGALPRTQLPKVYQEHDILVFPTIWDEPFGITLLEAMASCLAVVGTGTGGSAELIEHQNNALIFPPGDAEGCAKQVLTLADDAALYDEIRANGRNTVVERFRLRDTVRTIDDELALLAHDS